MPLTVPVLRVLEACRGEPTEGSPVLRPTSSNLDRRDCYRMALPDRKGRRRLCLHALQHAEITHAMDASVPLRDAQILAPHALEHCDRARGKLDRHGVHILVAYVVGI